ncbi:MULTISPECIES: Dps family protein [Malaciobacter]|uniref:DNA starvation/stationary phase protection protein n=1 Tax=Malaciobacter canalis TaxID=1912871 RepID=A0ABX4LXY2_9BACT|nr:MULTISPECIES: DNA starvation/stationary phase protection protein [Malaciobacter]PHO11198.1 DNA starvation/stationary phase protection protein [Malaciobacter canalis]PHO12253.1 DNA starvation/stationary phase protection protein [Malaciobacter marinus]QEE33288.1 DNA-binding ferritin-like protein [Malaciobacter canalis]RYA24521.1 DNA starvation/stationary phase protection protein [Malaciobacter halophilus]
MKKLLKQLKLIQGSSLVMYTKVHNYHWNIKGLQFFAIHEMTEKLYGEFSTIYDDAAERLLQLNEKPLILISEITENSFIKEDKKTDFDAKYVLSNILEDFEKFLKEFKKLSELADENGDNTTVAFADDNIAHLEKNIWMIKASIS